MHTNRRIEHAAKCGAVAARSIGTVCLLGFMIVSGMHDCAERERQHEQRNYLAQLVRRSADKSGNAHLQSRRDDNLSLKPAAPAAQARNVRDHQR